MYIPDYSKFKHYFDDKHKAKTAHLLSGKAKRVVIPVRKTQQPSQHREPTKVTLQMTSESQSEVERAEAKDKREKALKRRAGEKCITTKKIRRTNNNTSTTPSKTAKVLKCTPVREKDIFSS